MQTLNRILHVEDEPDIRTVAKMSLEMLGGFSVRQCASGQEALEVVGAYRPDLILLDVMMPDMDGPSILKALRDQPVAADIPVIFMTAKVQPQEVAEFKAMGALDVIAKPFDPMGLADEVRRIWASRADA